jgi:hypothetical protein
MLRILLIICHIVECLKPKTSHIDYFFYEGGMELGAPAPRNFKSEAGASLSFMRRCSKTFTPLNLVTIRKKPQTY